VTADVEAPAPPEGFVILPRGPFLTANGPLYHRPEAAPGAEHALFLRKLHTNTVGILHGGMLASFLDGLLGAAVMTASARLGVTVHLSIECLRMARPGEWLLGEARMTHATRDLAFAEGRAFVGQVDVGRASGVFKLMGATR
jgi:uncharacterized protein (TIGR00369 family)